MNVLSMGMTGDYTVAIEELSLIHISKVRCIIDDASKVSGMVSTTEDNLTVSGNIKTMNDDKVITFTELKDDDNKVKEGDPVVTLSLIHIFSVAVSGGVKLCLVIVYELKRYIRM